MNLAYRMRPRTLDEFVGQRHLMGEGKIIRSMLERDEVRSMILWGPPGSGKTTLAEVIAKTAKAAWRTISAVSMGKEALRAVIEEAEAAQLEGTSTILVVDEIHRWNKAQQDALLPFVESGLITLIGATTENPSFEVIGPLLSRCRVFVVSPLSAEELGEIVTRALTDKERGLGLSASLLDAEARELLIRLGGGDARMTLNALEAAVSLAEGKAVTAETVREVFQTKATGRYDKGGEEHYNTVSAFIKSLRASDPDAALYYLARMLEGGEEVKFIARRMMIFASEDIGLADRGALVQAVAAFTAATAVGLPEARLTLAHTALYLALAPKSRAVPNALTEAARAVRDLPNEPIPLALRNAPTKLMEELGYAEGYEWTEKRVGPKDKDASLLPENLSGRKFFKRT